MNHDYVPTSSSPYFDMLIFVKTASPSLYCLKDSSHVYCLSTLSLLLFEITWGHWWSTKCWKKSCDMHNAVHQVLHQNKCQRQKGLFFQCDDAWLGILKMLIYSHWMHVNLNIGHIPLRRNLKLFYKNMFFFTGLLCSYLSRLNF